MSERLELSRWKVLTATGLKLTTVEEYTAPVIGGFIERGVLFLCETTERHEMDRLRWEVNGSHIVAIRRAK